MLIDAMLIDTHCHLDVADFDDDRAAVIGRARAAGVAAQVVPAIALAGFEKLRDVCRTAPGLFPAYGLHPMYLAEHGRTHIDDLREWIVRERPVAIGECGLDFYVDGLDRDLQREYLLAQLALAREFDLPVILHARRAEEEIIATLRRIGGLRGVVHSWAGSAEQARQLWQLGFMLGVGGPVTYDRAKRLRALVAKMPIEYLLLETDAPDQPTSGHRGERNEPVRLTEIVTHIATLRDAGSAEIADATTRNALRLFDLALPGG